METDVLIVGCGPAGLQAAIHAARKKVSVTVVGRASNSAMVGTHIENCFGLEGVADGTDLLRIGVAQAKGFDCRIIDRNIIAAGRTENGFTFTTEDDEDIDAKAVIIATGVSRQRLNVPGERELFGRGVSYCAACDCNFYKGRAVAIVGDDTEAGSSAELMTRYASKTYWISKGPKASQKIIDKALGAGAVLVEDEVSSIDGTDRVEGVTLRSGQRIAVDGVFIELGAKSAADLVMDIDLMPEMDDTIKVDADCHTKVKGVFACGDITGPPRQLAKAIGQGCVAGSEAADYVKG